MFVFLLAHQLLHLSSHHYPYNRHAKSVCVNEFEKQNTFWQFC